MGIVEWARSSLTFSVLVGVSVKRNDLVLILDNNNEPFFLKKREQAICAGGFTLHKYESVSKKHHSKCEYCIGFELEWTILNESTADGRQCFT